MKSSETIRLVIGRELSTRTRSRAFRITTIANLVVVLGFVIAFKLLAGHAGTTGVGFTQSAEPLSGPLVSLGHAVGVDIKPSTVDQAAGEAQLRDGKLAVLVTGTPDGFQLVVKQDLSANLRNVFTVLARQIALNEGITRAGGDPATVNAAVERAGFPVHSLVPARQYQSARIALAIIAGILVYVSIMLYGQLVAQGVVEEKSSRIVEILLSTIRPWQLMAGKVAGIGLLGLAQLALTAVVGVGAGVALHTFSFPTGIAAGAAAWAVLWFLLGYLVYALLFGALGALVSRQEDVGGATAPALTAIVLPYILSITILPSNPTNGFLAVLSFVPFFSPMIMPMRIALGVAPLWQPLVALALTLALIVVLVWFAGRVYGNAVLRMGAKVRLREALSSR
jgi:ABC-2 type transport system permease protein